MSAVPMKTEVVGTVRSPDGEPSGEIDGVVIRQQGPGGWYILTKVEAVAWALKGYLWTHVPGDGRPVAIEAVDGNRDGYADYVRTVPDSTWKNNLLALPVWDRVRKRWVDGVSGYAASAPA